MRVDDLIQTFGEPRPVTAQPLRRWPDDSDDRVLMIDPHYVRASIDPEVPQKVELMQALWRVAVLVGCREKGRSPGHGQRFRPPADHPAQPGDIILVAPHFAWK